MNRGNEPIGTPVSLYAFIAQRTDKDIFIKKIGKLEIIMPVGFCSHAKGSVIINGKTLPIEASSGLNTANSAGTVGTITQREIDDESCIILFKSGSQYKFGILVNDATEILKVVRENLSKLN